LHIQYPFAKPFNYDRARTNHHNTMRCFSRRDARCILCYVTKNIRITRKDYTKLCEMDYMKLRFVRDWIFHKLGVLQYEWRFSNGQRTNHRCTNVEFMRL